MDEKLYFVCAFPVHGSPTLSKKEYDEIYDPGKMSDTYSEYLEKVSKENCTKKENIKIREWIVSTKNPIPDIKDLIEAYPDFKGFLCGKHYGVVDILLNGVGDNLCVEVLLP